MTAVIAAVLAAFIPFQADARPLSHSERTVLKQGDFWHKGCPVGLDDLRLLTLSYTDFKGAAQTGELVVNKAAVTPLSKAFGKLYRHDFRIRHMQFDDMYGPADGRPANGDTTQSFECRQAVPSPCSGGSGTGTWSNHAYGLAVDVNPLENPYVGCGQSRDPATRPYFNRANHRKGMVGGRAVRFFRSAGWGWGGAWTGSTKDYMHFSFNGH
ncbi:MAG: hypothetical protein QOF76_5456 [Solirubrobacteraceae bacterium]|nr:hypothetical protein [Solirubrobacteraceae bacterium]